MMIFALSGLIPIGLGIWLIIKGAAARSQAAASMEKAAAPDVEINKGPKPSNGTGLLVAGILLILLGWILPIVGVVFAMMG